MFARILVAIDGSEYSRHAVPAAIAMARKFQAEVRVLHVSEHDHGHAAVFSTETPAEATRLVADAAETIRDSGVVAIPEVRDVAVGHVAKSIVEAAAEFGAELIVMGSRGLSDVQGLLLGSVTHKVIQLTDTAVLVVRGPMPAKVRFAAPAKIAEPVAAC